MNEHLKSQHSESYKKSQKESLDKDKSCTALEPTKKRKLKAIMQTSRDGFKSLKLLDVNDLKAIKVYRKY